MTIDKTPVTEPTATDLSRDGLSGFQGPDDPERVMEQAKKEFSAKGSNARTPDGLFAVYRAMTLDEFNNGTLLSLGLQDHYKTFGIDLSRKFQSEYQCETPSEKATAELAALCFIRILDIQTGLASCLKTDTVTKVGVQYLAVLSKELDRAYRHYLTTIQTLWTFRQPPMQLNIKACTTVVGQNQIIQANNAPQ